MNTIIKHCFLAALCLMPAWARAQNGPEFSVADGVLDFGGKKGPATVKNVVKVLRQLYPDINIVVEPGAGDISIGDIELNHSTASMDLEAFSVASGGKFVFEEKTGMDATAVAAGAVAGTAPPALYIIRSSSPPATSPPQAKIAAFNLTPYCAMLTSTITNEFQRQKAKVSGIDELQRIINHSLSALSPGQASFGQNHSPKMDFYPDANLLVVIGSKEELQAAREIIEALPGMRGTLPPVWAEFTPAPVPAPAVMNRPLMPPKR